MCQTHLDKYRAKSKARQKNPLYRVQRIEYLREWRRERRIKGLCFECPSPTENGQTKCPIHLEQTRAYQQMKRDQGLCPCCGARPLCEGYSTCSTCLMRKRGRQWAKRLKDKDEAAEESQSTATR